jgi:hypothetical protein
MIVKNLEKNLTLSDLEVSHCQEVLKEKRKTHTLTFYIRSFDDEQAWVVVDA